VGYWDPNSALEFDPRRGRDTCATSSARACIKLNIASGGYFVLIFRRYRVKAQLCAAGGVRNPPEVLN
jgi:hypothetical protein